MGTTGRCMPIGMEIPGVRRWTARRPAIQNRETRGSRPMEHSEFRIGGEFWCGDKHWRCTDVGTRVIAAICLSDEQAIADPSWLNGPPYAVAELVFDEYDLGGCCPLEPTLHSRCGQESVLWLKIIGSPGWIIRHCAPHPFGVALRAINPAPRRVSEPILSSVGGSNPSLRRRAALIGRWAANAPERTFFDWLPGTDSNRRPTD